MLKFNNYIKLESNGSASGLLHRGGTIIGSSNSTNLFNYPVEENGEIVYKVKIKASESHLWIKGDDIKIIVSKSNPKNYRILFNDYFKENEERIRNHSLELLEKKAKVNPIAAKAVKYSSKDFEKIKNSSLNSNQIFYFCYLFNSIDRYSILTILLAILTLGLHFVKGMALRKLLIPILLVAILIYYVCTAVKICTETLSKATK